MFNIFLKKEANTKAQLIKVGLFYLLFLGIKDELFQGVRIF